MQREKMPQRRPRRCSSSFIRSTISMMTILSLLSPSDAFLGGHNRMMRRSSILKKEASLFMMSKSRYNGRKTSTKYIRIQPRNVRGNRRSFDLQTAVTTMSKVLPNGETSVVDLHSQLHFGDDLYFDFYNKDSFQTKYDHVFYELIVSDHMLQKNPNGSQYLEPLENASLKNRNPVAPPPTDENTAQSYGLNCQLNVIDYTKKKWIHCDATREEYQTILSNSDSSSNTNINTNAPIWAMASTATAPIQEYTSALFRPLTPSTANPNGVSGFSSQRLFSNLFLDGDELATFFRLLLWSFSPSPEVSILLLDWSSLVDPKPTGMISTIFIPVMEALLTGNLVEARQLVFAQLLVSGQTSGGRDLLLVRERNSVAMEKFMNSVDDESKSRNALLYGAMHCQDLQKRFENLGYSVSNVEWRTAWSTSVPTFGTDQSMAPAIQTANEKRSWGNFAFSGNANDIAIGLVIVPLYLLIGGFDWIATVKDIAQSLDEGSIVDGFAIAAFYLMRHLAMYLGLSKFVVEWDGEVKLFGES